VIWNQLYEPLNEDYVESKYRHSDPDGRRYRKDNCLNQNPDRPNLTFEWNGHVRTWRWTKDKMQALYEAGRLIYTKNGVPEYKRYLDESEGVALQSVWSDINPVNSQAREDTDYPTQKPEALLERIIKASSNEGDLVADFFCGSGTTAAVAERLGRKWIASDLGKFGVHTTRKRLIGVQRAQQAAGKPFRAFEVLNLGRYERQAYLNVGGRLSGAQKEAALAQKEGEFRELILRAYKAEPLADTSFFHGKLSGRLVVVGPINLPVGRLFVEEVITECRKRGAARADILAFEFEMGLFPAALEEAKQKGIDLAPKYIPAEVFDRRAVGKGQVVFHDISFVEATPRYDKKDKYSLQIELTDFSVYYTQGALEAAAASLKEGKSQVVCDAGQLYKLNKSKDGVISRDRLTRHWTDWVDYWAVDFDYMSRREIIRVAKEAGVEANSPSPAGGGVGEREPPLDNATAVPSLAGRAPDCIPGPHDGLGACSSKPPSSPPTPLPMGEGGEFEERWTGGFIFENEWQSFRTRQERNLELVTAPHTYTRAGRYTVAVKVIDIFGNDTMTLVPVSVG